MDRGMTLRPSTLAKRCPWGTSHPLYLTYHDEEWGVPLHDDRRLFEMLVLEGAQAGLSWLTVLKNREHYRRAFSDFDPRKIARYDSAKIKRLLANDKIIRNRLKIRSAVQNARAFLATQDDWATFDRYIWDFVDGRPKQNSWRHLGDVPAHTSRVGCDEQGSEAPWFQFRRLDHLLCVHASDRNGERPFGRLLPAPGRSPTAVSPVLLREVFTRRARPNADCDGGPAPRARAAC